MILTGRRDDILNTGAWSLWDLALAAIGVLREMDVVRVMHRELELWREELELQRGELIVLWEQAGLLRELVGSQDYMVQVLCGIERGEVVLKTCMVEGPSGAGTVPEDELEKRPEEYQKRICQVEAEVKEL